MRRCLFTALVLLPILQGCYIYVPLQTATPAIGAAVEFQISDRGRLDLSERLGGSVTRIEGRITGMTEDQYLINVASVGFVSGDRSRWSGESVRLNRNSVERMRLRTLSKSRSWTAAVVATAVIGGFIASRGLLGLFTGDREDPVPDPPPSFRLRFRS